VDALVLPGTSGFGLIGTQSWLFWLEWWTLRGAKLRISAHHAQPRLYRLKHPVVLYHLGNFHLNHRTPRSQQFWSTDEGLEGLDF